MGKRLCLALMAAGLLAAAAGAATASTMQFRPGGSISLIARGAISFDTEVADMICNVTLGGSLATEPITMRSTSVVGYVTRGTSNSCVNGTATLDAEAGEPWYIFYESINGTLPNAIVSFNLSIEFAVILLSWFGGVVACEFEGEMPVRYMVTGTPGSPYWGTEVLTRANALSAIATLAGTCPNRVSVHAFYGIQRQTVTVR